MAWLERHLIRRAHLGLFHGRDTYEIYAPFCRNPHVVHDIHLSKSDHIDPVALDAKVAAVATHVRPLKILYIGRADPMKGPLDWVDALDLVQRAGVDFQAQWIGDGSALVQMRARIVDKGLEARIATPGHTSDRVAVLAAMRSADVFMFCHKTHESPRCLIEALASGTPIVGYSGAFARDLIAGHGGGALVPLDDVAALARLVIELSRAPARLAALMAKAAADGMPYDDLSVFQHRSQLIREHLPARR